MFPSHDPGGCASLPDNGQNAYEAKMTSKLSKKVRVGDPPPLRDVYDSIYEEIYEADWNDCSNKAYKYALILRLMGYPADFVATKLTFPYTDDKTGKEKVRVVYHALVRVRNMYYCPTWGEWTPDLDHFGELVQVIYFHETKYWGTEFTPRNHLLYGKPSKEAQR